jgi:hypothetical protein
MTMTPFELSGCTLRATVCLASDEGISERRFFTPCNTSMMERRASTTCFQPVGNMSVPDPPELPVLKIALQYILSEVRSEKRLLNEWIESWRRKYPGLSIYHV